MLVRWLMALVVSICAGCDSSDEGQPSGMETCLADAECPADQACEHVDGVDEGLCVRPCSSCGADDVCTSIDDLHFPSSCFHTCEQECAPGFWCWAQGLCVPESWRDPICAVFPALDGCT